MTSAAEVWIGGWLAGLLQRAPSGRVGFRPNPSWALDARAPVLGQQFIDEPTAAVWGGRTGELPGFFANLLPQGKNRDLLVELNQAEDDLDLLVKLGGDLPGDVAVKPGGQGSALEEPPPTATPEDPPRLRIKASLTGMQPKFSMSRIGHPISGPLVRALVDRVQQAWLDLGAGSGFDEAERAAIDAHLRRVPLARRHR